MNSNIQHTEAKNKNTIKKGKENKMNKSTAKYKLKPFNKKKLAEACSWSYEENTMFDCCEDPYWIGLYNLPKESRDAIVDAFLAKRNGDCRPLEALPIAGRNLVLGLELAQKWYETMAAQHEDFKQAVITLCNDYEKNPEPYSKRIKFEYDDEESPYVTDEIPSIAAMNIWYSMPQKEYSRIVIGEFLIAKGINLDDRWTKAEKDLATTDMQWRQVLSPARTQLIELLRDLADQYLTAVPKTKIEYL